MTVDPWRIYYVVPCHYTRPEPKPKYVVIVYTATEPKGFLINTEINVWLLIDPQKVSCHARILVAEHPCLRYDSWVDCIDLYPFTEAELNNKMDFVSPAAKLGILAAVKNSTTLIKREKKIILKG